MAHFVIHYREIAIKGGNRRYFERVLADSLRLALQPARVEIRILSGRLVLSSTEAPPDTEAILARLPGIAFIARATQLARDLEAIKVEAVRQSRDVTAKRFRILTKRSDKSFPMNSLDVNREVGAAVQAATLMKVDLEHPEHVVYIELVGPTAFVYTRKTAGIGGLPLGSSGTVVALLSGGIDSPVAAYQMIRRGVKVILVHFHNQSRHQSQVRDKLRDLASVLARHQLISRLYLIPFGDLQAAIVQAVPAPARMVSYRRMMLELAAEIAAREGAKAFITGDCLGQVASQTLDNLAAINAVARLPILAPLIGNDKDEIIAIARRIGTYDISVRPYEDCCTFLVARHPDTRVNPHHLAAQESRIPLAELAREALSDAEMEDFGPAA